MTATLEDWKSFPWDSKIEEMNSFVSQSKEAKEQSLQARKILAENTKQLKQKVKTLEQELQGNSIVEATTKEVKNAVKAYQQEIDNLTKRCKTAETNYATLAQDLSQLPNPAKITTLSTTDNNSSKEELMQLRREVAEYEVEFRNLKNQDITIRKLEAKIAQLQAKEQERMEHDQQSSEMKEIESRRINEALERESAMERKVQNLELQLKAEKAGREATQAHLLQTDEGLNQREAAWEAQRQILIDDANHLRENLHIVTRERDELRMQVAAASSSSHSPPSEGSAAMADLVAERKAYEAEVAELAETAAVLRDEIKAKDDQMADERRSYQSKIDSFEREKSNLTKTLESVQSQLDSAPSQEVVDSMKRELRILKRLEYNAEDHDEPEVAGLDEEKGLEAVLVGKLRRAESDLVLERNAKNELSKEIDSIKASLSDAVKAKEEAEKLVLSLERDLEKAIATPKASDRKRIEEQNPPIIESDPSELESVLDPDVPPSTPKAPQTPKISQTASERASDDHSVATIVMAQRDRLRARCEALEAERDSFKRELQVQVQNAESLKTDNTKLYEKVRYLQSYSKGAKPRIRSDDDLDLEALEQRYEASVDPFRQFSKAERQRKLNEMSPIERTVFIIAKTVLSTREMRTGLFFYMCALHFLVFSTTYHWSHAESGCHKDNEYLSHLPPALPAEKGPGDGAVDGHNNN